jgi:regulator of cell morphogenesis and NO signaling
MSEATISRTIGEMAAENPAAAAVFEKAGLDYCCGGGQTLSEACRAAGISAGEVEESIRQAGEKRTQTAARNWTAEPLTDLIAHIRNVHHAYTRAALERLTPLFDKVCGAHEKNHSELREMRAVFAGLAQELTLHLMKEEMALFPYVERMEEAAVEKSAAPPAPFGSVRNPIAMMQSEHDGAGDALRQLRTLGGGYAVPADGCASYRSLYQALEELEADLHQHIHLENNILFPRAIAMERAR